MNPPKKIEPKAAVSNRTRLQRILRKMLLDKSAAKPASNGSNVLRRVIE